MPGSTLFFDALPSLGDLTAVDSQNSEFLFQIAGFFFAT